MVDLLTGNPAEAPAWLRMFQGAQQEPQAPAAPTPEAPQPQMAPMQLPMMGGMPSAPPPDPMMDSVNRAMQTITDAYARQKAGMPTDRVTEILKARSAEKPSWDEIGQAISSSFGSISTTGDRKFIGVGEALNNIRANKILEAEKLARVQIDDERLVNERDRVLLDAAGKLIQQRGQIAGAYKEWLENFKGTVPPETFKEIAKVSAEALVNQPVGTAEQAYHAMATAISKMPLPAALDKTADERFLTRYKELRTKQRLGIPLDSMEQDDLDFISGYRFTKVTPTPSGVQILQPPMQVIPGQAQPQAQPQQGAATTTTPIPGGPKVTQVEVEKKALPEKVQTEFESGLRTLESLQRMKDGLEKTGIVSGRWQKMKMAIGAGDAQAIAFDTAVKNFKVDAQALIKGIPSNFDIETFINTLPDLSLPENINEARIKWHSRNIHLLMALKVGYFKGLGYRIPQEIGDIASTYGVNLEDIKPLTRQEVQQKTGELKIDAIKQTAEQTRVGKDGKTYYKLGGKWLTVE